MATLPVEPWRPSIEEWRRLGELGFFEEFDLRVELLDGVITPMSPPNPAHALAVEFLNLWAFESLGRRYRIRVDSPLSLDERWEPLPDVAIVSHDQPQPWHPSGATLGIEVSVSSLKKDREAKRPAYARFGIREYWIVAPEERRLEVFRDPAGDDYATTLALTSGTVESSAIPGLRLDLDELWAWVSQESG